MLIRVVWPFTVLHFDYFLQRFEPSLATDGVAELELEALAATGHIIYAHT